MAKNLKFRFPGPVQKTVKPVPPEQRGKLVEFPKQKSPRSVKRKTLRSAVK